MRQYQGMDVKRHGISYGLDKSEHFHEETASGDFLDRLLDALLFNMASTSTKKMYSQALRREGRDSILVMLNP